MARNKPAPKALFAVKHDFYASLDHLAQEAILLLQAVDFVTKHGELKPKVKELLSERATAFRNALSPQEPGGSNQP